MSRLGRDEERRPVADLPRSTLHLSAQSQVQRTRSGSCVDVRARTRAHVRAGAYIAVGINLIVVWIEGIIDLLRG